MDSRLFRIRSRCRRRSWRWCRWSILVFYFHCLSFVIDIVMRCDFCFSKIQIFKHNKFLIIQQRGIQFKCYCDIPVCSCRCELHCNRIQSIDWLPCSLIHQHTRQFIFFARSKIAVFNLISDNSTFGRLNNMISILLIGCRCMNLRFLEFHCLILIVDIRMHSDFDPFLRAAFKRNNGNVPLQKIRRNFKDNLYRSI